MSRNLMKALGVGAVLAVLSAGSAFAAVATGSVNVRTGPGTWYSKVDTLYRGEQVAIVDRNGGWCFVQKSGPDGWVSCRYLTGGVIVYRSPQPSVRLSLGFGISPPMHHHHHHNGGDWWDDNPDHDWDNNHGGDDGDGYWSGGGPMGGGSFSIY